jgi:hypothetical protein
LEAWGGWFDSNIPDQKTMEGVVANKMLVERVVDLETKSDIMWDMIEALLAKLPEYDKYLILRKGIIERATKMRVAKAKKKRQLSSKPGNISNESKAQNKS